MCCEDTDDVIAGLAQQAVDKLRSHVGKGDQAAALAKLHAALGALLVAEGGEA